MPSADLDRAKVCKRTKEMVSAFCSSLSRVVWIVQPLERPVVSAGRSHVLFTVRGSIALSFTL